MKVSDTAERPEKLLARLGVASRREVARWLAAGRLRAQGQVLRGGERIRPGDSLRLDGRPLHLPTTEAEQRVLLYNKPVGEIVTRHDPQGRSTVFSALPRLHGGRWIAVGRLDISTTGLLLLTSDGDLAAHLMHPRNALERRYLVRVDGRLTATQTRALIQGVLLEDGWARFISCRARTSAQGRNQWYYASLLEGRKREVRRLFEAMNLRVNRLHRVGYGPIDLPRDLVSGKWRELSEDERGRLQASV